MESQQSQVNIRELAEAFELQSEELLHYVNRITGKVVMVRREELRYVEEEEDICEEGFLDDFPKWQRELLLDAKKIYDSHDYVPIPSRSAINIYAIMEDFCSSIKNGEIQDRLLDAISGKGAFGRFKTAIHCYKIEDGWYHFLNEKLKAKAIEWCKEQNIRYTTSLISIEKK